MAYPAEVCSNLPCVLEWVNTYIGTIIAVVAIGFTFWQVSVARKHNRISLRPRLFFHVETGYTTVQDVQVILSVRNFGLGPAFVKGIEYRVFGRLFDLSSPAEIQDALTQIFGQRWAEAEQLFELVETYAIAKDGALSLARVATVHTESTGYDPLPRLREAISVTVHYESPYQESFACTWPEAAP